MADDRILVGRFGAAHGIRGEVRLKSFTADPQAIGAYKPLLDAAGTRQFTIESLRHLKDDLFVARLREIRDRTAAEALTNLDLFVPREALPSPGEDEYYLADLVGLKVLDEAGELSGRVVAVHNFGAGDVLEIAPAGGGATMLLPFTKDVVPRVDVKAGSLTLRPPAEVEGDGAEAADPRRDPKDQKLRAL